MKNFFVLLGILILAGMGCARMNHDKSLGRHYTTDGQAVFCWNTRTLLPGADPNSFVLIDRPADSYYDYAKDATHVYLDCQTLPEADPSTFILMSEYNIYSKDATHVYFEGRLIPGADPQTFTVLTDIHPGLFSKDQQYVYAGSGILTGADPKTFPGPRPTAIGQCVTTMIASVGERLGTPGSGSQIIYTNGIFAVSYVQIPAMDNSRVGDKVTLCLVSLPENCPPGDNRGKEFKAINLRTHLSWSELDSVHLCGGA